MIDVTKYGIWHFACFHLFRSQQNSEYFKFSRWKEKKFWKCLPEIGLIGQEPKKQCCVCVFSWYYLYATLFTIRIFPLSGFKELRNCRKTSLKICRLALRWVKMRNIRLLWLGSYHFSQSDCEIGKKIKTYVQRNRKDLWQKHNNMYVKKIYIRKISQNCVCFLPLRICILLQVYKHGSLFFCQAISDRISKPSETKCFLLTFAWQLWNHHRLDLKLRCEIIQNHLSLPYNFLEKCVRCMWYYSNWTKI